MINICDLVEKKNNEISKRESDGYLKQDYLQNGNKKYITNSELKTTCSKNYNKIGNNSEQYTKYINYKDILGSNINTTELVNIFKGLFLNRDILIDRNSLPSETKIENKILELITNRIDIDSKKYITNEEFDDIKQELDTWKTEYLSDLNPDSLCQYKYTELEDAIIDGKKLLFNGKEYGKIAETDGQDVKDSSIYNEDDNNLYVLNSHVNTKKQLVKDEEDNCLVRKTDTLIPEKWIANPNLEINDNGTKWSKKCDDNTTCMPDDYVEVDKYLIKKEELNGVIQNCNIKKNERWGLQKEVEKENGEKIKLGRIGTTYQHYKQYSEHIDDIANIKEKEDNCHYFESELIGNKVNIINTKDNINEWYGKHGNADDNYMNTNEFDNRLNTDCMILNSEWDDSNNRTTTGYGLIGNEKGKYGMITNLDFDTRNNDKYITNTKCIEDINRKRFEHEQNFTDSPNNELINNRKEQIKTLANSKNESTLNNLSNIDNLNDLYGKCIEEHTPDGETEEPVISTSEFNNRIITNRDNELDWWYQNAMNTAVSDVNNEYKNKKYSDGIKENQTCPPDNEVWLLPNTCIEDDHMCRPNDNTVSMSSYNTAIQAEKDRLNYITDLPCNNIEYNNGTNKMTAIVRKGFDDNVDNYANKYDDGTTMCNKNTNKPNNYKEPGTDSVCIDSQFCTTNTRTHNEFINKYSIEKERETCNELNRNICSAYELPIQSNNITNLPIEVINPIENTLPPLFTYGRIDDITKPPNYSQI